MIQFEIKGADEVVARLRGLPEKMIAKAVRPGARKGANVIRNAARVNARTVDDANTPKAIWKNIQTQESVKGGKRRNAIMMRVGVDGGARQLYKDTKLNRRKGRVGQKTQGGKGATFYWRFLEFGTQKMRARPFMVPALNNNAGKATDVVVAEINKQIDKLMAQGKV